jgi:hypothetical protein
MVINREGKRKADVRALNCEEKLIHKSGFVKPGFQPGFQPARCQFPQYPGGVL